MYLSINLASLVQTMLIEKSFVPNGPHFYVQQSVFSASHNIHVVVVKNKCRKGSKTPRCLLSLSQSTVKWLFLKKKKNLTLKTDTKTTIYTKPETLRIGPQYFFVCN